MKLKDLIILLVLSRLYLILRSSLEISGCSIPSLFSIVVQFTMCSCFLFPWLCYVICIKLFVFHEINEDLVWWCCCLVIVFWSGARACIRNKGEWRWHTLPSSKRKKRMEDGVSSKDEDEWIQGEVLLIQGKYEEEDEMMKDKWKRERRKGYGLTNDQNALVSRFG